MRYDIDIIERQRDIKKFVYPIRHQVFEVELGYPEEDGHVLCDLDAISNHYILLHKRSPIGVISVADITGLNFLLEKYGVDKSLQVAKPHKLAILEEFEGRIDLRKLLNPLNRELEKYNFITVHVCPPSNNPNYFKHLQMAGKFEKYFGLKSMGKGYTLSGAKMLFLGREI